MVLIWFVSGKERKKGGCLSFLVQKQSRQPKKRIAFKIPEEAGRTWLV
jgi:hypothetical protein